MTILVTGATGTIGTQVVSQLIQRDAPVRALVRPGDTAQLPPGVEVARGDLLDVDAVRKALRGARTLFLLNAVVPDEFTQALIALNLAREAGIERIVYFSVIHSDVYVNVPHFAGKHAVERMLEEMGFCATVLRPAYFMGNDAGLKDAILEHGVYPMPIGDKGLSMVDARDIGEVAALELLRRHRAPEPLPLTRMNVVGPDRLTGEGIARLWSEALGRPVVYGGDDASPFEQAVRQYGPSWLAYDMRTMAERFVSDGMLAEPGDTERLTELLGRPLRSYADFTREMAKAWRKA